MKQAKLEDMFEYLPKSKIKAGEGLEEGMYPFYTSSENQTKYLNEYQHGPGCLVFGTGGKASVHLATSKFATSTDCITIRPKAKAKVDAGYVFQYLKGNMQVLENGFKGAGLKHISKAYLSEIQIPHPEDINDQIRIAHLLGKVKGLIAQRKQHLQQLDDLLKSIFLEMFGPQAPGYSEWPLVEIRDLAANHKGAMRTGPFGSNLLHSEFTTEGDVAVLGIDNAVQNRFAWGEWRFITNEKYRELESYRIYPGDVIVTIMGTIGRSAVIPDDIPVAINTKHLAAITLNKEIANPLFVSYSIHSSPFILNQFKSKNRGAIMSGLNLGLIKETKLKRPPIELQNQFAAIHKKIDETKIQYQQSLTDLESLYGALSQKAFKGELDLSRVPLSAIQAILEAEAIVKLDGEATATVFSMPESEFSHAVPIDRLRLKPLLHQWLDLYRERNHQDGDKFLPELFLTVAQKRLDELHPDIPIDLGVEGYEYVKEWVFDKLQEGLLEQLRDITDKDDHGDPIYGNELILKFRV